MIDALFADEDAGRFDLPDAPELSEESEVVGDGFILLEPSKDASRSYGDSEYDHSGADFLNREEYARKVYNTLDIELDLPEPEHGKLVVNGVNDSQVKSPSEPLEEVREEICEIAKYTGITNDWRVRRGMSTPDIEVTYQGHVQKEADDIIESVRERLAYCEDMAEPVDPEEITKAVAVEAGMRVPELKLPYQVGPIDEQKGPENDPDYGHFDGNFALEDSVDGTDNGPEYRE